MNPSFFRLFVLLIYMSAIIQPCFASSVSVSKTELTVDLTTDLMAMAVAASIAPEEDLPILYKNYMTIHSRLAAVCIKNKYMPTSIDSNNKIINPTKDDTALLQFLLANVLLTKSYEINEQTSSSQREMIEQAWRNIEQTEMGPIFHDILIKQMILKGYITESTDTYDALEYIDFNSFFEIAATEYTFSSAEDEEYLRKQYFSGAKALSTFQMSRTSEAAEDYREYKILVETNEALRVELQKYRSRIEISGSQDGTISYIGTGEDISRYQALENTIESNENRINEIFDKYQIASTFEIEYFSVMGAGTNAITGQSLSGKYLTIPLSLLINTAHQKQDSYIVWTSAIYAAYYRNEAYMSGEEWNEFNRYITLHENLRALENENVQLRQRINEIQGTGINNSRKEAYITPSEEKELQTLIERRTKILSLKSKYTAELEEYRKNNDLSIGYSNSRYYNDGIAPFNSGYYDWNLIDSISNCLYLSSYNRQIVYENGAYTNSHTSLIKSEGLAESEDVLSEINELNSFRKTYVHSSGRLANTIGSYPEDVRAYSARQLSDLYLAKAEFQLSIVKNPDIRNAVYLASTQQARILTLAIPHKEVYLYYDSQNNPYVYVHYTKNIQIETFNSIIEEFSQNSDINEEVAIIANWNKRTTAEYMIKMMYSTSSMLSADVAINNLIKQRENNPLIIPVTTNELSMLIQNPLITPSQHASLQSLLNDDALAMAKSNDTNLQELRYVYVDLYFDPIIPASGNIFEEYSNWPNDNTPRSVNQNNLIKLTNDIRTFETIYAILPEDKRAEYTIPYDAKNLLPLFGIGATKYEIARTIISEDIQTTPELRSICEDTIRDYRIDTIKNRLAILLVILITLAIIGYVAYKYWYLRRPIVNIEIKESRSDYEVWISNNGQKSAKISRMVTFGEDIVSPFFSDAKIRLMDIENDRFTVVGTLEPGENKLIVIKKPAIDSQNDDDEYLEDIEKLE